MQVKYDKIGGNYNQTRKADKFITSKFIEYLNPTKDGLYLDLGCGTGNYTIELFKTGINVLGIDPSEKMVMYAKSRNNAVEWVIGTAEKNRISGRCY